MPSTKRAAAFLDTVCAQVRWKQAHETIRRDLADHIEDQAEAYQKGGLARERAFKRAVQEMGDPVDVGAQLDASYRPRLMWSVFLPVLAVILMGVVIQCAQYALLTPDGGAAAENYGKLAVATAVGGALAALAYRLNLYRFTILCCGLYPIACVVAFCSGDPAFPIGNADVGFYAMLLVPVFLAGIAYLMRNGGPCAVVLFNLLFAAPVLQTILVTRELSYFAGLIGCVAVLFAAICNGCFRCKRWVAVLLSLATWACVLAVLGINPYRYKQWHVMVLPQFTQAGQDEPYRVAIREALQGARWFGRGSLTKAAAELIDGPVELAGSGVFEGVGAESIRRSSRWGAMTNELPVYLIYRFGWVIGLAPVAALIGAIAAGVSRCVRMQSLLGRLYGAAILTVFAAQTALYLLPCFGLPGGRGYPLPFLSLGYDAQICNLALMGGLLSLFRTDGLTRERRGIKRRC